MNARLAVLENELKTDELFQGAKKLAKRKGISISSAIDLRVSIYQKNSKSNNEAAAWDIRGGQAKKLILC